MTALSLRALKKRYGDVIAVDGIDLEVRAGECFGLLGPNGAGKTTTIEICEGLTAPDSGEVELLGRRWSDHERELRERLGIQLQDTQLSEKLTVRETLNLFRSFYRQSRPVDEVIAMVQLEEKRDARVGTLSGGQKQRLALACALVGDPELLFLDEPTAGMDPRARADTWQLVRELRERGATVVLTTHYMDEAEHLCDRVAILDRGSIVAAGTPVEVTSNVTEPTLRFTTAKPLDTGRLGRILDREVRSSGSEYLVSGTPSPAIIAAVTSWLAEEGAQLTELRTGHASLEEVFLRLTEEAPTVEDVPPGRGRRSAR